MIVLGAGMAGLMAAAVMRNEVDVIIEANQGLPKNHSAVLRFKSSIVGDTLNIPFKKVKALKAVQPWKNGMADVMAYSQKTNGSLSLRSITSANGELLERYIAPADFVEQMAERVTCSKQFGRTVEKKFFVKEPEGSIISTLPMGVLMDLLEWPGPKPEFQSLPGYNILATVHDCDMYGSLYIPEPGIYPYRVSINGNQLIAEMVTRFQGTSSQKVLDDALSQSLSALHLHESQVHDIRFVPQKFMKILPIDEEVRRKFIMWASEKYKVYSLGRFATWRPGLLLDDLVQDIRIIQRIIKSSNYELRSKP